jgi:hypothetical protein
MDKLWIIPAIFLVVACTTIEPLPEEVREADGIGGASGKVEIVKWVGQLILTTIGVFNVNIKIERTGNGRD